MKVCYVDESGNDSNDPCLVMVGVVVDGHRLHRTREEFGELFDQIQGLFQENLKELKGSKMIFGRDRWRNVDAKIRENIVMFFCRWVADRKHHIALAAIDRHRFGEVDGRTFPQVADDLWLAACLHIALQLQKHHQGKAKNKGRTFLFVDENKQKADKLSELLFDPPAWTDAYYGRRKKQAKLDQLIDSAFAVKSHHAGLVQVADLYAFILRRYAELRDYESTEKWDGEKSLIDECTNILASRLLPKPTRWPARTTAPCCKWYNKIAPPSLLTLGS
ncbi:MAG TPA: DUF3800 domain-containing protein [Burkholderiales bacterium]|nr:DUF3800 domain-containing protein [Burkholderiales bacterium]